MINEIETVIKQRLKLHPDNYIATQECWDQEVEILTRDISKTIEFIETECDDETFYWIGEVFEDVAEITQSKEFVTAIKKRAEKIIDDEERRSVEVDIRDAEYNIDEK